MKQLKINWICKIVAGAAIFTSCSSEDGKKSDTTITPPVTTVDQIKTLDPSVPLKHGGYVKDADFVSIKAKIDANQEPWVSGYNKLIANSHAQSTYTANPVATLIRGGGSAEEPLPDNYSRAMNDVAAAYQLGLRWKLTGDAQYAQAAVNILNSWASTCTRISGDSNAALAAGIYGYEFAIAGEQLRNYSGWAAADFTKYKEWMRTVFYNLNYSWLSTHFGCHPQHAWSNWDLCNMASVMAISVLVDDRSMYNYVIDYYQNGKGCGNNFVTIFEPFPSPNSNMAQMQESGRDQGHCMLSLALLTTVCQIAWTQGDDLWGFRDNIVLKASEYVAKYNVAYLDVPYTVYSWHEGDPWTGCGVKLTELPAIGSSGRGGNRPMWAMIYNHYAKIKKLPAASVYYTSLGVKSAQPEGGGGDYGGNSGGFDSLGFGTLLFTLE
ncbi:alginate lyase family protein [Flavobacterium undicola]|uniref:alginate lyase family protein n=1 Tax=Flavobacterium undicola TaxID=1932779 RepID=UPI001379068F|nr:alginate lyase family protein [Flavobacterium undicola]MBA0883881.1 alginate lyase family protein [Flavobacterium undicola]